MKIRRKIALIFTILTSIVLLVSFTIIYFLSGKYAQANFNERLLGKATLAAWKYFEQDEMAAQPYKKIIEDYNHSLPEASEIVLNVSDTVKVRDSLQRIMPLSSVKKLMSRGKVSFVNHHKQGVGLYYHDNQGNFIIIITAIDRYGIQKQEDLLKILLCIFFGSVVFIFFIGQFYARRILTPIVHILRNVRKINATNLSLRLKEEAGEDELTELTQMFNQMLERLEVSFAMQKNFIHHASHELKNPITAILGETEVTLGKKRTIDEYISCLKVVITETERLDQLTRNLLAVAQTDFDLSSMPLEMIRMNELMQELKDAFNKTEYKNRLEFLFNSQFESPENFFMYGISSLIRSAFVNLLENACKFSGNRSVIVNISKNNTNIQIQISDKGIGIPPDELGNLFQPFYRASNALSYKGSGVGLSLVKKIINLHGGIIHISSELGQGTKIEISLPVLTGRTI